MTLFTTYHEAIEWIHSRLAFGEIRNKA
ncbi:hypothetical protein CGLO_13941 [Colletotrichum gloeosporioides Cg-14]|uniref:Uncharacterized protein n=1 Tax=Colletotrichum gloeosporioides (strain Cg-14) TaxID=1237896 RepID=T0L603_COLGC|nr:hypothetical protein CGLO_13941 [Colletotrichum gloeosporioides Cg-14]